LVSAQEQGSTANTLMLQSLLARGDRSRIQHQVAAFAPGKPQAAVIRTLRVPVHELELSRTRFSPTAPSDLLRLAREFRPQIVHAWGPMAQLLGAGLQRLLKSRPALVWSVTGTYPATEEAGFLDRTKQRLLIKTAGIPNRIVYTSTVAAAQYRRVGFPETSALVIAPGMDVERHKPDFAARQKVRERLELDAKAVLIGMLAPFQPEYDHSTFIKATAEIIKFNPNAYVVLAGRGVQRGNHALMALLGGGSLATRTALLGEWSDLSALFNACDVVCSSAISDNARLNLAAAMMCGVPCVGTGVGAQGEVLGQFGISVEQGSPSALTKGITRILEMPPDKRAFFAQSARKHAMQNYNLQTAVERYQALYGELITKNTVKLEEQVEFQVEEVSSPQPAVSSQT
jgi:glycosyltransferase involved in cell wall biosynthesis